MNHRLNQEKYREKLEKNKNKFKNKKEEIWKEETKKSTKYKKVDQKFYEKAEKNLKQENCKGEVKTTKTLFIYAINVLWVQKETLQSNVPDANNGIMTNALSAALHYH